MRFNQEEPLHTQEVLPEQGPDAVEENVGGGFAAIFAHDASSKYLLQIADNGSLPTRMLDQLAIHRDHEVRIAVADNPGTSLETLWELAVDPHVDVRFALAENHNIPAEILCFLIGDENPYVACRAQKTVSRVQNAGTVGKVVKGSWLLGSTEVQPERQAKSG